MFTTAQWNSGGIGSEEMTLASKVDNLRLSKRRAIRNLNLEASYYAYDEDHATLLRLFGYPLTDFHRAGLDLEELRITIFSHALGEFGSGAVHPSILHDVATVVVDAVAQMGRLERVFVIREARFVKYNTVKLCKEIEWLVDNRLAEHEWTTMQDSAGKNMIVVNSSENRAEKKGVTVELVAYSASLI